MNEVQRRVVAGAAAEMFGRGGKTAVASASGMSRNTVIRAEAEVAVGIKPSDRLRAVGGGDKPLIDKQPGLLAALDELVHPDTRGNPMSLLRWTSKSSTHLAGELVARGYDVSSRTVLRILNQLGYSLQANAKVTEPGTSKWNRIEHRIISFITMNWRGRPLTSLRTIIELISATTTSTGLTIQAAHDPAWYAKGVRISDTELAAVPLHPHDFHGEWNYTINAQSDLS